MTGVAPGDETVATPHDTPAEPAPVAGGTGSGMGDGAVQIAYLHSSRVSHSFHASLMNTVAYDKTLGLNLIASMPFAVSCSGPNSLPEGRNLAVSHFLDSTPHEWLMFIDTDMGFEADAVERLLLAADPVKRPVVGGLCFAMKYMGSDGRGGYRVMPVPTLFMLAKNDKQGMGFANRFRYPPDTLVQVAGTGAAFLLIHRSVLERIREDEGDVWFDFVQYGDGAQVSEDLSFCWRLTRLQVPVYVDTRVSITHHKEMWLSDADYSQPEREPMARLMSAAKDPVLGHAGSDRWTGGDRKDEL